MTYIEAKAIAAALEAECSRLGAPVDAFREGVTMGPMGLLPDSVRLNPEYRKAKAAYDAAFQQLRAFNGFYVKIFKSEIHANRKYK